MDAKTWQAHKIRWKREWQRADQALGTWETYVEDVEKYLKWCDENGLQSDALEAADLYIDHREQLNGRHSARHAARALKAWSKHMHADGQWSTNAFARLKPPSEPVPTRAPMATEADLEALLDACVPSAGAVSRGWEPLRDKAIFLTLAWSGCRRGELAGLHLEHVDLVEQTLYFPKTKNGSARTVYVHSDAVGAILRYLSAVEADRPEGETALWLSAHDLKPMQAGGITQMIQRKAKKAGVDVSAHAFRRMFASKWMAAGGQETALKTQAGWKTSAMIARYTKVDLEKNAQLEAKRLFER